MSNRAIIRLAVLLAGCMAQASPAAAQASPGMFRPPGYGTPGGGGASRLGTYGEIGDRAYAAPGATGAGVVGRESRRYDARINVPVGDYGVTIPVPGGVGTVEMYHAGSSSTPATGSGATSQAPAGPPARAAPSTRPE